MSSVPLQIITDLFYKCLNNKDRWYKGGKSYDMIIQSDGRVHLKHYGTTIYNYDPKTKKVTFKNSSKNLLGYASGAYSASDRDAINSVAYYTGIGSAFINDYTLYTNSEGKMRSFKQMEEKVLQRMSRRRY